MSAPTIVNLAIKAMILVLMLSLPPIIVAAAVGILVSLFQALTQIQEQTLSFAIKLIAVTLTLVIAGRWIGEEIFTYAMNIFNQFPYLLK